MTKHTFQSERLLQVSLRLKSVEMDLTLQIDTENQQQI